MSSIAIPRGASPTRLRSPSGGDLPLFGPDIPASTLACDRLRAVTLTATEAHASRSTMKTRDSKTAALALRKGNGKPELGEFVALYGLQIPDRLAHVIDAIEESRALLELPNDWDGNGTPGFTEQTWTRAAEVLIAFATLLATHHRVMVEDVEILPGANGGLDIDVRSGDRQLLFAVSSHPQQEVRFYGDDGRRGKQVKATLDPSTIPKWLLVWMAE